MDPFWRSSPDTGSYRIGDSQSEEERLAELGRSLFRKELDRLNQPELDRVRSPRADTVSYEGNLFASSSEERIENGYKTSYLNRITKDADAEKRMLRKSKLAKELLLARDRLDNILSRYACCFAGGGSLPPPTISHSIARHNIVLKEGVILGPPHGMRRRSREDDSFVEETIAKLLKAGLLQKVSEVGFASQVHVAKTPGRDKRFTIDYRYINDLTKANALNFPFPGWTNFCSASRDRPSSVRSTPRRGFGRSPWGSAGS